MASREMEQELAAQWAKLLGVKAIASDDNFFALGGHSLLGVKLIGAVQDKFGLGDALKLSDLFEHPTLADFAAHLESLTAPSEEWGEI